MIAVKLTCRKKVSCKNYLEGAWFQDAFSITVSRSPIFANHVILSVLQTHLLSKRTNWLNPLVFRLYSHSPLNGHVSSNISVFATVKVPKQELHCSRVLWQESKEVALISQIQIPRNFSCLCKKLAVQVSRLQKFWWICIWCILLLSKTDDIICFIGYENFVGWFTFIANHLNSWWC